MFIILLFEKAGFLIFSTNLILTENIRFRCVNGLLKMFVSQTFGRTLAIGPPAGDSLWHLSCLENSLPRTDAKQLEAKPMPQEDAATELAVFTFQLRGKATSSNEILGLQETIIKGPCSLHLLPT